MKRIISTAVAGILLAGSALAQTAAPPAADPNTPAVATPQTQNSTAPVEGANSFTEAQARSRMEEAGYQGVTGLMKDDKGIWQATATKGGTQMNVSMDYQGNVVSR